MHADLSNAMDKILARRTLQLAAAAAMLAVLAACSSSGGAPTTVNQPANISTAQQYTGPPAQNADIQAFQVNLWQNIIPSNRCGGCHHQGGQSPQFARSDDVNQAYQAALPLVNLTNPSQSTLVLKVGGGHNCWVADPSACASTMLVWIQNWLGAGATSSTSIVLTAPPVQAAGGGKQFPADPTVGNPSYQASVYPLLTKFCSGCHNPSSASPQQPYFADPNNIDAAYVAAQPKIDLAQPDQSRFYVRLASEFHHCWPTASSNGAPDCPGSAAAMLAQITAFANGIPITPIDPALVVSNAVSLTQGTIASGGSRFEGSLIAKYMFETGQGSTAYDTSGVTPEADLTLSGNVSWVGGWGLNFGMGSSAQASTSSSAKLANLIQESGEYSIEAWAAPANVAQTAAWIVSYSGSNTTRNVTLGQAAVQYEGFTRSSVTDTNGMPPLVTTTTNGAAQAALQHIVLTYDPVNGQKLYVNGVFTGDMDPSKGGSLANWDSSFALVLGNETSGQRQWQGVIKMVAIYNTALNQTQITQNFNAGVGQKYYLLFGVSSLTGVNQSYIMFTASQYDNYSYLFYQPAFISLDPNATIPANLQLAGMRIGVNGLLAPAAQSFATLNTTLGGASYNSTTGQPLSPLGTVIPVSLGPANDLFFLSFDQLGSNTHSFVDPPGIPVAPVPNNTAVPDYGVATYERINNSLARITGVPITDQVVQTLYMSSQQAMPATPLISAFVSSQQTAISGLANAYCGELMASSSLRDAFFGTGLDSSLGASASGFFGASGSAQRAIVINALANGAVGTTVSPQMASTVQAEVDALLTRVPQINAAATVTQATVAACTATLASAAVTLQ
ncbi:MAG TPA: LamG-like jellyroll fold domain-containing protein [Steroidobacteraceae bacterium]|nr:LamG-like jellyroll fold domain-containing protein [Steroidobacteraceae bacterium]